MSGWKAAGIPHVIGTSSANQESLDPFSDIDPLISQVTHENNIAEQHSRNKWAKKRGFCSACVDFYENESDSDEDIYVLEDDDCNVFDNFEDIEH